MKLSIGTAQFGFKYGICNKNGVVNKKEVKKIIEYCKLNKIQCIDTAQGYGKSHKVLGSIGLKKFKVTSKISDLKISKNKNLDNVVISEINKILKDLNQKKIYALLIHNTNQLKGKMGKKIYEILKILKKKKIY